MKNLINDLAYPTLYATFWLIVHFVILGLSFPVYATAVSLLYGVGHYFAQKKKGHIALSADSIALPLALLTVIASIIIANLFPVMPVDHDLFINAVSNFVIAFLVSFAGAHVFVLLSVFLYSYLFEKNKNAKH